MPEIRSDDRSEFRTLLEDSGSGTAADFAAKLRAGSADAHKDPSLERSLPGGIRRNGCRLATDGRLIALPSRTPGAEPRAAHMERSQRFECVGCSAQLCCALRRGNGRCLPPNPKAPHHAAGQLLKCAGQDRRRHAESVPVVVFDDELVDPMEDELHLLLGLSTRAQALRGNGRCLLHGQVSLQTRGKLLRLRCGGYGAAAGRGTASVCVGVRVHRARQIEARAAFIFRFSTRSSETEPRAPDRGGCLQAAVAPPPSPRMPRHQRVHLVPQRMEHPTMLNNTSTAPKARE